MKQYPHQNNMKQISLVEVLTYRKRARVCVCVCVCVCDRERGRKWNKYCMSFMHTSRDVWVRGWLRVCDPNCSRISANNSFVRLNAMKFNVKKPYSLRFTEIWYIAAVSNTRPARGSNAAREQENEDFIRNIEAISKKDWVLTQFFSP